MIDVTVTPPSSPTPAAPTPFDALSNREREVLEMLIDGKQLKEIAKSMHRSIKTIEKHRQGIGRKLRVSSIGEICKLYYTHQLDALERVAASLRSAAGIKKAATAEEVQ